MKVKPNKEEKKSKQAPAAAKPSANLLDLDDCKNPSKSVIYLLYLLFVTWKELNLQMNQSCLRIVNLRLVQLQITLVY